MVSADDVALQLSRDSIVAVVCELFDRFLIRVNGTSVEFSDAAMFDDICLRSGWEPAELRRQFEYVDIGHQNNQIHIKFHKVIYGT